MDSKEVYGFISHIEPKLTSGLIVVSIGKLYPIFSILVLRALPIELLPTLIIAPFPTVDVMVVIPGNE